ncbi:MBL fold metallo-hydrolase [Flavobacterium sp. 7A]|uniref:MBL fold metallo-hydrolase n=1 Tax=Flavobacterium sp. 7A TaxID=2940571 RepID=UPI002227B954|nr:MBL fold metallo-hydrolase [Flavobacterium sp. 7A]MCW2120289.1 glyoxylase-like metal-dependent hydrolase (beta-lactamase superfamily II) [Flavobacterium sp. 7A]
MLIKIQAVTNEHFKANTYIIKSSTNETACYLIDIGNYDGVMNILEKNQYIKSVFLTHAHYDHICGINEIVNQFPECTIFCSKYTKEALQDSKVNLSFYHNTPVIYKGNNVRILTEEDTCDLFVNVKLTTLETPGHNEGSLTFKIEQAIFSGDSLIPETAVITKLKSGNKADAKKSIIKIRDNASKNDVIYPGHGNFFEANKINWNFYL